MAKVRVRELIPKIFLQIVINNTGKLRHLSFVCTCCIALQHIRFIKNNSKIILKRRFYTANLHDFAVFYTLLHFNIMPVKNSCTKNYND
jgi:hypothetical protein